MFTEQLEWIHYLHKIRHPFLDNVIKLFDFFDRQEFFLILIPIIWFGYSWKVGLKIYYIMGLSHIVNSLLKNLCALPRPFHLDPTVGLIHVKGYGFPSGAAQSAILLSGLLLLYWKSRWKWCIACAFMVSLSFSRIYLGVHFPIDIVGGWSVGILLLGVYCFVFPKVERFFECKSHLHAFILQCVLLIAVMFFLPSTAIVSLCASAIGFACGIFINSMPRMHTFFPKTRLERSLRIVISILGIFLIHSLGSKLFHFQSLNMIFLLFMSIGLWISVGTDYTCKKASPLA